MSIRKIGTPFKGNTRENTVYRLLTEPQTSVKYPYIVVSDKVGASADVLTISDLRRFKVKFRGRFKKATGLEITVASARKLDAVGVGQWFENVRELYSFCQSYRCQFILSSGATIVHEMVSGVSFDAILKKCGINPAEHWASLERWLDGKLSRRVSI